MTDKKTKSLEPEAVEFYKALGERLKTARTLANCSQERAAQALNITFQQIQKFESGANRIAVDKLLTLSDFYNVPLSFLLGTDERHKELSSQNFSGVFYEMIKSFLALPNDQAKQAAVMHTEYLNILFNYGLKSD